MFGTCIAVIVHWLVCSFDLHLLCYYSSCVGPAVDFCQTHAVSQGDPQWVLGCFYVKQCWLSTILIFHLGYQYYVCVYNLFTALHNCSSSGSHYSKTKILSVMIFNDSFYNNNAVLQMLNTYKWLYNLQSYNVNWYNISYLNWRSLCMITSSLVFSFFYLLIIIILSLFLLLYISLLYNSYYAVLISAYIVSMT